VLKMPMAQTMQPGSLVIVLGYSPSLVLLRLWVNSLLFPRIRGQA